MKILLVVLAGASLIAGEKRIQQKDLPPAVQKAAQEASKGAQVAGYSKETEKGKTFYEMELKVNGRTRDVSFDEQGNTVSVEQQVALSDVPPAVQEGLKKAAGKGRITLVETVTKGSVVTYEAAVKGGPSKEVTVDANGKPVQ